MKHTKTCPKCGGNKILNVIGNPVQSWSITQIPTGRTSFSSVPVRRFICCNCSFSEEWIDEEDISTLSSKFPLL